MEKSEKTEGGVEVDDASKPDLTANGNNRLSQPASPSLGKTTGEDATKPMSKNQLKKKRKWEQKMEIKKRRKQQEKEAKRAKAIAEGRDLEQEQKFAEQRRLEGLSKKRRMERWKSTRLVLAQKSFQVCMDCSFENQMTKKEINSLAQQIRYSYSRIRRSDYPCILTITSLAQDSGTIKHLKNVQGFEDWSQWGIFDTTPDSLEQYFDGKEMPPTDDSHAPRRRPRLSDLVYLTSDSEHTLQDLDDSKVYVIGGIVDRNRLRRAAITRAEALGIATARLPIERHLQEMHSTRVLTCNHVLEILLCYRKHGRDWKKALMEVLPSRKEAKFADCDRQLPGNSTESPTSDPARTEASHEATTGVKETTDREEKVASVHE